MYILSPQSILIVKVWAFVPENVRENGDLAATLRKKNMWDFRFSQSIQ
jgi:hypothetical protein